MLGELQQWVLRVRFPGPEKIAVRDRQVRHTWLAWQLFWGVMGTLALYQLAESTRRLWRTRKAPRGVATTTGPFSGEP